MKSQHLKKLNPKGKNTSYGAGMPDKPGVYFFKRGKDTLYIGKATSLRSRVRSYFANDLIATRGPTIVDMVFKSSTVTWQETDSVLEALLLEAELIKKYQPYYNVQEKDDKSFNCVVITKDIFPQVLVIRKRELMGKDKKFYQAIYGPFTNGMQLREAMKIIRRIFPYVDAQSAKRDNAEFYRQIGLSPEITTPKPLLRKEGINFSRPYKGGVAEGRGGNLQEAYKKNIANLKLFFSGKKKEVVKNMKKEMKEKAAEKDFEYAAQIRNRIFALEHINDISLLKEDATASLENKYFQNTSTTFRIEAYDVAHMSGQNMVGVMVVVEDGRVAKQEYKKFIIRTQKGSNDTGALEEVLSRRFRHTEWGLPSLIAVDGSTAQLNVAKRVLKRYQFDLPIVAVVKDDKHKARAIIGDEALIKAHKKSILLANSEAHRFAIAFHKKKRDDNFIPTSPRLHRARK